MKTLTRIALIATGALLFAGSSAADSRHHGHRHHHGHGHSSFGIYFGTPWYYSPPVYMPPRVIVVPAPQAPVYIEQAPAPGSNQYWYFCQQANAYYPQVSDCPGGWISVPPR